MAKVLKYVFNLPKIDYEALSNKLCEGTERIRTYYYDCEPYLSKFPTPEEENRRKEAGRFFDKLRFLKRFEVRLGRLQKIGGEYKQKGVDVLMSVDLVKLASSRTVDMAILVTGDSDFVPAIKASKEINPGMVVVVYYSKQPPMYVHRELLQACDESHEIAKELIDSVKKDGSPESS